MHLHEDAEKVHESWHHRSGDDGAIGKIQEFDHQERSGSQHRGGDLAAGRRSCLHRACEVALVADPDHGGNGQRADRDGVGDRRAAQHADLGRSAGVAPGDARRDVQEQLTEPDTGRHHAEQHEMKHIGRHHANGDAIDALAGQVLMVNQLRPVRAGVLQQARKRPAKQCVGAKAQRDQRQRPAHAAPGRLEHGEEQHAAHHHVQVARVAYPHGEVLEHPGDVQHAGGAGQRQRPVD